MQISTYVILGIGILILVCIPLMGVLKKALPAILERSADLETIEGSLHTLQSQVREREREVHGLIARLNTLASDRTRQTRELHRLQREIEEAVRRMPLFVHELGEPAPGLQKFQIKLSRHAGPPTTIDATQPPNPIWDHANLIDVWARNADEARQRADSSFPTKLGYLKVVVGIGHAAPRAIRLRDTA